MNFVQSDELHEVAILFIGFFLEIVMNKLIAPSSSRCGNDARGGNAREKVLRACVFWSLNASPRHLPLSALTRSRLYPRSSLKYSEIPHPGEVMVAVTTID